MKKEYYIIALLLISLFGYKASAQVTVIGEVNARSEFRNGFKRPILESQNPALFVEQRSRVYFNYKEEKFETQITFQDVRFWGATGQVYKSDQSLTHIAEGWGKYNFSSAFSFKAGRQIISYDNQRFFGGLEWALQGRRHDALLFMYEKEGFKLHLGGAFNQNPADGGEPVRLTGTGYTQTNITGNPAGAYHATGNYKHMEYLWANKKFDEGSFSLYLVNDARQTGVGIDSVYSRQTYGLMASKNLGALTLDGEFFYQGGKVNGKDLNASLIALSATIKTDITPITIGYERLSGTDYDETEENNSFGPIFGTNHAFYGFMDYFFVGNGFQGGLQDIYLKTKFKFAGGALLVHGHQFLSAAKVLDSNLDEADASLGTEIDLVYVKALTPGVTWKIGYSQMFETDAMLAAKGIPLDSKIGGNNWAWVQIIFKPTLFKSENK